MKDRTRGGGRLPRGARKVPLRPDSGAPTESWAGRAEDRERGGEVNGSAGRKRSADFDECGMNGRARWRPDARPYILPARLEEASEGSPERPVTLAPSELDPRPRQMVRNPTLPGPAWTSIEE